MQVAHLNTILEVIREQLILLNQSSRIDVSNFPDSLANSYFRFRGVYKPYAMGKLRFIERDTVVALYLRAVNVVIAQIIE